MQNDIQVIQSEMPVYEQAQRAEIDIQVSTAKKYPRHIARFMDNTIATVTMDDETAASCGYSLPRGGKKIQGASVHLARIMAQFYGNIRVEKRGGEIGPKFVTAIATAFDLETNYGVKVEATRKITDKNGQRYNDDMINTTMSAAMAIAERNAILAVIPKAFIDKAYKAAQKKLVGDLSTEEKLTAARKRMVEFFLKEYDVTEAEILGVFGKTSITQITPEDMATLKGLIQAIKDGDTTVDEAFGRIKNNDDPAEATKRGDNFEKEQDDDPAAFEAQQQADKKKASKPSDPEGKLNL